MATILELLAPDALLNLRELIMKAKTKSKRSTLNDVLPEYNFSEGVRGKYAKRYAHSNNIVVIQQDVAKYFSDSQDVNEALRTLLRIKKKGGGKTV